MLLQFRPLLHAKGQDLVHLHLIYLEDLGLYIAPPRYSVGPTQRRSKLNSDDLKNRFQMLVRRLSV